MKIFLVGYMASGKTRRGRAMAEEKGLRFIDLDLYIEEREFKTIRDIFKKYGEEAFRKMETRYLKEICEFYDDFVLSCGGGTPCFNGNMDYMNAQGETIFLNATVDVITARLIRGKWKRPLVASLTVA